jgi:serine/threonine protein kinase
MQNVGLTASTAVIVTPLYAAPELFSGEGPTEKVDIWSFGMILYEILFGESVFPADATLWQMPELVKSFRPKIDQKHCGFILKVVIERCWSVNPEDRPTINDLEDAFRQLNFDFFNGAEPAVDSTAVGAYLSVLGRVKRIS